MDLAAARRHDEWNLLALGSLNAAHSLWWVGWGPLAPLAARLLTPLFLADCAYLVCDLGWLVFSPRCVAPEVRRTLLIHHVIVVGCIPVAWSHPVLMAHLLRTWVVEIHSCVHIAARHLPSPKLRAALQRLSKPIFVGLRLIGFPLTWFAYARDRAALTDAMREAQVPLRCHLPLSIAHFAMYGLMLKWGHTLLFSKRRGGASPDTKAD
ncbi:hypothetical protein AB1Y20_021992 [Prymnesium parvum]|uniref:TLC domain-containing protein n=1 Tax=Prymnesium parvum TaxID=97485 RepID=A0AB34JFZ4_PRYPA